MPSKKKGSSRKRAQNKELSFDGGGAQVKAINTWDDVEKDSEDEFAEQREKMLLDSSKSRYMGGSGSEEEEEGEEVLALDVTDSEDEEEEGTSAEEDTMMQDVNKSEEEEEEEDNALAWGSSKGTYYNADAASEDEEDMANEEKEALRLQKLHVSSMAADDFMDGDEVFESRLGRKSRKDGEGTEIERLEYSETDRAELSKEEKVAWLHRQAPELIGLMEDFNDWMKEMDEGLWPILRKALSMRLAEEVKPALKLLKLKYQAVLSYLSHLSFYLSLASKASDPRSVRTHPCVRMLVKDRKTLARISSLESTPVMEGCMMMLEMNVEQGADAVAKTQDFLSQEMEENDEEKAEEEEEDSSAAALEELMTRSKAARRERKKDGVANEASRSSIIKLDAEEGTTEMQYEESLVLGAAVPGKRKRVKATDLGDFGELDALDEVDAEEKGRRKRALRFYAAQIDAKEAKRNKSGRFTGDTDLPYRDPANQVLAHAKRTAALEAKTQAQRREEGPGDLGLDLGMDFGEVDDDADAYYKAVKQAKEAKRQAKSDQAAAFAEEERQAVMEGAGEEDEVDEGSKRMASYKILKNRGLTPYRKKENRNPRVKHRSKFEKAKKKLKSVKRVADPSTQGAYEGELTGIKVGLSRAVRF
ncbi:MAG: Sas10 C-terminal domain-containing protein [Piptocephalis tieghemiana]|nr:MAG: Sas10 C-terminal domain-containing protein [Piptocephalis tieghemiana]